MPAISVQMSRSSSTMRISWPMTLQTVRDLTGGSLCGRCVRTYRRDFLRVPPEYQTDTSPATLAVIQGEIAAMIFHDLLDDREAEARPLAARGHIGLREPLTAFLGQTLAVVVDDDAHRCVIVTQRQRDLARR